MVRRLAIVGVLVLAACSTASETPPPAPGSQAGSQAESELGIDLGEDVGAPPETPRAAPRRVLITHATVPTLDVGRGVAAHLAAGEIRSWRELGRPSARLRLVRSVAVVERDPYAVGWVPLRDVGPTVNVVSVAGRDPVADDARATTLMVVGDVMLVRGVPDPKAALAPFAARLRGADLTVGNLESTLSLDGEPTQGDDSFGASPALLRPLRAAGFDALSLANNHAGDFGQTALLDTLAAMRRSPIGTFGAGRDLADASRPAYVERNGVRFAFVGFNAIGETPRAEQGVPGALSIRMPPRTGPFVEADLGHVADVVREAGRRADVVVVLPHWGTQYTHTPEPIQRQVSRRLVRAGADLVVGGHPHWVQGIDDVAGVPVVHSLGNFVFDMDFMEQTMEGIVLETTWWGAELKAIRLVPYRMDPSDFAPRPVVGAVAAAILRDVWSTSTGPFAPLVD